VARTLGRTGTGALYSVALPMARPALAAGVSLALMECLNDIGAVSYLGVSTLTLSVYDAWIQRSSLAGAAQLALVMFVFVVMLLALERYGRRNVRFQTGRTDRPVSRVVLPDGKGLLAASACLVPFTFGFLIPVSVLIDAALAQSAHAPWRDYLSAAQNSMMLSAIAALVVIACAVVIGAAIRLTQGRLVTAAARISSLGYAIPGTVIGIGLIVPLAAFDNAISAFFNENFGFRTGLLLSGSAFALVLAYTIRFMAVGFGAIDAGWQRLSPNLDAASRTLGASPLRMLGEVHIPLLRPAIGAAALLVFVDCMKELSATLLLRPFNFETLATHIYVYASQEQFEKSAIAALTIVAAGLIPLLLLHRTLTSPQTLAAMPGTAGENSDNP
jgi:iron(III) transport system permease protein